ncbi:DUF1715-domain-containing protein [Suhomyces tanzawaensis NRRL Y-17324]|uniref:DUF1715-domain-containing protein n=1 Tax=Suhomyces tanzawaensis NRRL Y-17324 TaxID=984487 RepID=A0A1E4SKT5_9ASCO|nr:DUF1715-domain-containing protein [Suhomyces tanzawaensis NRRL Y-17324]ODV80116.1 DUF1715-domain-containing protein [Suhomyces tanzawaensis NRRL Y-17324]
MDVDLDFDIDGDDILNLEEEYYQKGFEEGQSDASKEQLREGKEYGYQTGFQRYLIIGYIQGLVEVWEKNLLSYELKMLANHLVQLKTIIDDVPITNEASDVEEFEKRVNKARNKVRVVCTTLKESWKLQGLDKMIIEVGGKLQVSENADEMW